MTKYNLYIAIEDVSNHSPAREGPTLDCKNITAKDVYGLLRITLEKWVRILDEETESDS